MRDFRDRSWRELRRCYMLFLLLYDCRSKHGDVRGARQVAKFEPNAIAKIAVADDENQCADNA